MGFFFSSAYDDLETVCLAVGENLKNETITVFVNETKKDCKLSNRCFERQGKENICPVRSYRKNIIETSKRKMVFIITTSKNKYNTYNFIVQLGAHSGRNWAGLISCHNEQGWYPAASFVDSRGECGLSSIIIATGIDNLKPELRYFSGKFAVILVDETQVENNK